VNVVLTPAAEPLLAIDALEVEYGPFGDAVRVIEGVSLQLHAGDTLGVVGESGSGKSTLALAILRLLGTAGRMSGGQVRFDGEDLRAMPEPALRRIRGKRIGMIFQEPMSSLHPAHRVGDQVAEVLRLHDRLGRRAAAERAVELLDQVGIAAARSHARSYPHELSGGQRQRVMIAQAIACAPALLIADEPTTALDASTRRQVLEVLGDLQSRYGMALLVISHDLGLMSALTRRVLVMRHGRQVEQGDTTQVLGAPRDPYTQSLIASRPRPRSECDRLPVGAEGRGRDLDGMDQSEMELAEMDRVAMSPCGRDLGRELLPTARDQGPSHKSSGALRAQGPSHNGSGALRDHDLSHNADEGFDALLEVSGLTVHHRRRRAWFGRRDTGRPAVDNVSFTLQRGQTLGLLGESGSGKTTLARAVLRLIEADAGSIRLGGSDLRKQSSTTMRRSRKRIQIVFQDPVASLNPRLTVRQTLHEPLVVHGLAPGFAERDARVSALLAQVGLDADSLDRYPHAFSGGQRQRIGIARALAVEPELIVCDESVSALDLSVQAQILNLLRDLQDSLGLAYLFISHDIDVIRFMADQIAVMRAGRLVEIGPADRICTEPRHPYTRSLLEASRWGR
jgi:peptide/nickel transport system ATP-binding protein